MAEPVFLRGEGGRFLKGNYSPGRPPGARVRYSEAFLRDFQNDWREHGAEVMARVRGEDPVAYLRIAAGLAAHLAPRPQPEPSPPMPDPFAALFGPPRRESDGLAERLAEAIIQHPDVDFAALGDRDLEDLLGKELADFYRDRILCRNR